MYSVSVVSEVVYFFLRILKILLLHTAVPEVYISYQVSQIITPWSCCVINIDQIMSVVKRTRIDIAPVMLVVVFS